MRNAFADEVTKLAEKNNKIFFCSGDIGNRVFDLYKSKFPKRFMNCGVAEANMMGMAAGLALSGMQPIVYTITPFTTSRVIEQIRDDVCYNDANVIIVGVGSGLCYASLGPTHHSCEDIAFLRVIPNMTVICPGDAVEVRLALRESLKLKKPVYIRLGKKGEPIIHEKEPNFKIGKAIVMKEGTDVCLLSTGNILPIAIEASEKLEKENISAKVVSFHTVKPLDENLLKEVFSKFKTVVTIEEHSLLGGFGSAVAEWITDQEPQKARLIKIGTYDDFFHQAGSQDYARKRLGLTVDNIVKKILEKTKF